MLIHQSTIKSWERCPEQYRLEADGHPREQLSATAYGSVMHVALHVLEREQDLAKAIATFKYYWHPLHIEAICEPVQIWLPRESYGSLAARGVETLKRYWDLLQFDDSELLALEYEFAVPIHGTVDRETGKPHTLVGSVDRLALRRSRRKPVVSIEDFKTGKQPSYLRHNVQGTAYCYASLQPEFWAGNPELGTEGFGERAHELVELTDSDVARRFWWINLNTGRWVNGGFRGERDYARLRLAVQAVCDSIQAGIFPLSLSGEVCEHCSYREICGGIGLDDEAGAA